MEWDHLERNIFILVSYGSLGYIVLNIIALNMNGTGLNCAGDDVLRLSDEESQVTLLALISVL